MKLRVKSWVAILILVVVEALGGEPKPVSVLSRPVNDFSLGRTDVLSALLWLGHDERVSFGIELPGPDLSREVQVAADKATVGEVVKKILGSSHAYLLSDSDGVILIRKKGVNPPSWLDHKLRQFEMPRLELLTAGNALWMRLETDLNPTIKGFLGDSPVTDPIVYVGPFSERRKTIRQLLIKIVASSRGASWFPTIPGARVPCAGTINRFWTLTATSGRCGNRPK